MACSRVSDSFYLGIRNRHFVQQGEQGSLHGYAVQVSRPYSCNRVLYHRPRQLRSRICEQTSPVQTYLRELKISNDSVDKREPTLSHEVAVTAQERSVDIYSAAQIAKRSPRAVGGVPRLTQICLWGRWATRYVLVLISDRLS